MRRLAFGLLLAILSLGSSSSLWAADAAPAAASSQTPAPTATPVAATKSAPSMATVAPAIAAPVATPAPSAATVAPAPAESAPATEPSNAPAAAAAARADSSTNGIPQRGMNMANVEHIFGTPLQKYEAVGKPPITRWDYPDYVVFFEYNMVLHTVMKN